MENPIRKIQPIDIDDLTAISRKTFVDTFSSYNSAENMRKYLDDHIQKDKLLTELNNPLSYFYFITHHDQVAGYLKLNTGEAQTELKTSDSIEIERIYVLSEFHGAGLGQLLLNHAVSIAKDKNADFLWLGVWEKNARAIRFYEKNGFIQFSKHIFMLGDDEQTDVMMKKEL